MSGYGLNCEEETATAFQLAGGNAEIVHINDVVDGIKKLQNYHVIAFPGGFSFGDDTGSGKAFASKLNNHLRLALQEFAARDTLMIGICNGFQILTSAGLLSGALTFNTSARYYDRWVDLKVTSKSPWLRGIKKFSCPIAHGEGRYYADKKTLQQLKKDNMIALTYFKGEMSTLFDLEPNPNGSLLNIAGITDTTGRILGVMPHPERSYFFTQLPNWTFVKESLSRKGKRLPTYGPGKKLFENAVQYFLS